MFLSARLDGQLLGVAALKQLDESHAELKSLHTVEAARGQRVGRALVDNLPAVAADRNFRRMSLETGIMEAFRSRPLAVRPGRVQSVCALRRLCIQSDQARHDHRDRACRPHHTRRAPSRGAIRWLLHVTTLGVWVL